MGYVPASRLLVSEVEMLIDGILSFRSMRLCGWKGRQGAALDLHATCKMSTAVGAVMLLVAFEENGEGNIGLSHRLLLEAKRKSIPFFAFNPSVMKYMRAENSME